MSRLVTGRDAASRGVAEGIGIGKLERQALGDVALRAGCSLVDAFVCCDPCWHAWVRARVMEHLRGVRFWKELGGDDFGLLKACCRATLELVEDVLARLATGADTVHVLMWAVDTQQPFDEVVAILGTLDMNARRLPRFAWLSPTAPCGRA